MVIIRQANLSDAKELPKIERSAAQSFRGHADFAWIADGEVQSEQEHIGYIQQQMEWVAVNEINQPIGFINIQKLDDSLHINEVSVCQKWQGKGIGKLLIQNVLDYASQNSYPFVTLTTFRYIPWNAPYYQRLGFALIEKHQLSDDMKLILQEEVDAGFKAEDRCAMIMPVNHK